MYEQISCHWSFTTTNGKVNKRKNKKEKQKQKQKRKTKKEKQKMLTTFLKYIEELMNT